MKVICTPAAGIKLFGKIVLFACLMACTQEAIATIRYVKSGATGGGSSWSDASSDLQGMLVASSSGDTIWVCNGTYQPSSGQSYTMAEGVKIFGGFIGTETSLSQRAAPTLFACMLEGNNAAVIYNGAGLTTAALLDGFTITGGTNSGVYNNNSSPSFANCIFIYNKFNSIVTETGLQYVYGGGGMNNVFNSYPVLYNCQFEGNIGTNGGGIGNYFYSNATCYNCSFTNNSGDGAVGGYMAGCSLVNCTIDSNYSSAGGGGVSVRNYGSIQAENCSFTNNYGTYGGVVFGTLGASIYFDNCTVSNNYCDSYAGAIAAETGTTVHLINTTLSGNAASYGGALYCKNSTCVLDNCLISGNYGGKGGAAYFYGLGYGCTFLNCTISGNYGLSGNKAVIYGTNGIATLQNTIVYNNSGTIYGSPLSYYNSLVQGLTDTANGNISGTTDPLFIDPQAADGFNTTAGGDFRLQPCSPVINKGNNAYIVTGYGYSSGTDLAGKTRVYNGTIDMGAYEQQGATTGIIYVKAGAIGTGNSWSCPTGDLQQAINLAVSGNQIWVVGGTYIPNRRADATGTVSVGDRNNAFLLKSGVKIYGGFAGTEASLTDRNLSLTANASILSGDLNNDDIGFTNNGENAYHVVVSAGDVDTALLDGFTIQGGNCNGNNAVAINGQSIGTNGGGGIHCNNSSPALSHLIITGNAGRYGAGLCMSSSSPAVTNSTIYGNAGYYGGGIIASNCGASLTNVLISGNTAVEQGGGMYNEWAVAPTLTNVTIAGNTANYNSGAMYNNLAVPLNISNSIVYGNNSGINNNSGTPSIQYSLVQGETSTANGNISGSTDPSFVNQQAAGLSTAGNYSLQTCSPAINAGNSTLYNSGQTPDLSTITTDLNSAARIQGMAVDMGVYEYAGNPSGADLLAINGDLAVATISGNTTLTAATSACRMVATLTPTGTGTALTGTVNAAVWIESSQPTDYVQRHYQITPVANASTATGRVTLYFTQADFDDFNAVNTVLLPTGSTDATHIANLLIEKRSGTSSDGTGLPATYSGTPVTITPAAADIVWNSTTARWEVTFDVTGFSGFFVKTTVPPLPLTLLSFTGSRYNEYNQLQWETADEVNTQNFVLERSADGSSFAAIATIAANGSGDGAYSYKDYTGFSGRVYYRLRMVDIDGRYTYSTIVTLIKNGSNVVSIYPNPANDDLYINAGTGLLNSQAGLYDANGRLLQTIVITTIPQIIPVKHLTSGLYILHFADGTTEKFIKK